MQFFRRGANVMKRYAIPRVCQNFLDACVSIAGKALRTCLCGLKLIKLIKNEKSKNGQNK